MRLDPKNWHRPIYFGLCSAHEATYKAKFSCRHRWNVYIMKCFDFVPYDFSNLIGGLKNIAVLSALSSSFDVILSRTSINDNKLKLFWYFCICMAYWYSKKSFCALPNEEGADNDNFRAHLLFWTPPRFAESWFEVHYYDHTIPKDFIFRKQLRMHLITFSRFLLAFPKSIAVHQIP